LDSIEPHLLQLHLWKRSRPGPKSQRKARCYPRPARQSYRASGQHIGSCSTGATHKGPATS